MLIRIIWILAVVVFVFVAFPTVSFTQNAIGHGMVQDSSGGTEKKEKKEDEPTSQAQENQVIPTADTSPDKKGGVNPYLFLGIVVLVLVAFVIVLHVKGARE